MAPRPTWRWSDVGGLPTRAPRARLTIDVDLATKDWLRSVAAAGGSSMSEAAASILRAVRVDDEAAEGSAGDDAGD